MTRLGGKSRSLRLVLPHKGITKLRSHFSFLQDNVWVSLFFTPALLVLGPDTILWWWPGDPPEWAPVVTGGIGLLANLLCVLVIGLVLRIFGHRDTTSPVESSSVVADDEARTPPRRSVLKTINLVSGIAAVITGVGTLALFFVPGILDSLDFSTTSPSEASVAEASPTHTVAIPTPTPLSVRSGTIDQNLTKDRLIASVKASGTVSGQDASALRAARILVNRGDYEGAVEAALAGGSYGGQTIALTLVTHGAIKDGQHVHALTAAGKLYYVSSHDSVELEVFCAIRDAVSVLLVGHGQTIDMPTERYPSFEQMRNAAVSGGSYGGQAKSLRKISEIAVMLRKYDIAIDTASVIYYFSSQSEALTFVARCAVEEGLFNYALAAAAQINHVPTKSKVTASVMDAIAAAESEPFLSFVDFSSSSCRR